MDGVKIRKAKPDDAVAAAPLIYSTGPIQFNLAYGSEARATSLISRLFARRGNISSFQYARMAEKSGKVAGILVLHDRDIIRNAYARTGAELVRLAGPLFLFYRLTLYLRQGLMDPEPSQNELFVAQVAVVSSFRGQGIGRLLMKEAEDVANMKEYASISLGVSKNNRPAISLYKSLGYSIADVLESPWLKRRFGFAGVYRMVKSIQK